MDENEISDEKFFKKVEKMMNHINKYAEKHDYSLDEYVTSLTIILTDIVGITDDPILVMKEITDDLNSSIGALMESEEFLKSREEFLKG